MDDRETQDFDGHMQAIIDEDDDPDQMLARYAQWMRDTAGPDDWHRVLMGYNWGEGAGTPSWIVRQPSCDRATALLAFWNAQPEYYLQFGGDRDKVEMFAREDFDLIELVRSRWQSGAYTRGEIAFSLDDPCTWQRDFAALDVEFSERVAIDMPVDMRKPVTGRQLDSSDIIEGIPARFWPEDQR